MDRLPSFIDDLRSDIQPSYKDSLVHHGIKGMHWGVRRYQNSDGSLTSAGKSRYSLNPIKRIQQKSVEKDQARKEKTARAWERRADKYEEKAPEFEKAAKTLERDGLNGNSIYMRRLNEADWTDVYDGGKQHREDFKFIIDQLKQASKDCKTYSKAYRDAAQKIRQSDDKHGVARDKYLKQIKQNGYNVADDYDWIVDLDFY